MIRHVCRWKTVDVYTAELSAGMAFQGHQADLDVAEAYLRGNPRDRFIAGRNLLREMVAGVLGASVSLNLPSGQAPTIDYPGYFVSHARSARVWVGAIATQPVGIDCEEERESLPNNEELGLDFASMGFAQQYRCWVRLEAWVKASGRGLGGRVPVEIQSWVNEARDCEGAVTWGGLDYWMHDLRLEIPAAVCIRA